MTTATFSSQQVTEGKPTRFKLINFSLVFSSSQSSFSQGDITPTNCTITNFSGSGTTYSFDVSVNLANPGVVSLQIDENTLTGGNSEIVYSFDFATGFSGLTSGTLSENTVWCNRVRLTGDVVVPNGVTLTFEDNCYIESYGYRIIIQNGGALNTGNERLPMGSQIRSQIIFS